MEKARWKGQGSTPGGDFPMPAMIVFLTFFAVAIQAGCQGAIQLALCPLG
jgi:hypothetical protein